MRQLPKGKWIAGTTPFFITEQGGITCKDKLFVNEISCVLDYKTAVYDSNNIFDITKDAYPNGYNGVLINVSIKSVSEENKTVEFYAPVFAGKEYRFARSVSNYAASFEEHLKKFKDVNPIFSCNCVLNYLYGELVGKATPPFAGPVTFGEIAYQLLNQTLVFAEIISK